MSEFDQLPPELVFHVVNFLGCREVTALSQTCKRLQQVCQQDCVWQSLCQKDYNFVSLEGWGESTTFYDVYSKVLYCYGKCLGLWRNSETPYGIFIHVKLEPGQLSARLCQYPLTRPRYESCVQDPLRWFSPLFTVSLKEGQGQVTCRKHCPPSSLHLKVKDGILNFQCDRCLDISNNTDAASRCARWADESRQGLDIRHSVTQKEFLVAELTKLWSCYALKQFCLPAQSRVSPVTLGLYRGTYGAHGIEVISFTLAENGYELLGDKILGDPNVPAGEISVYVDLRQPLFLNEEQQDYNAVKDMHPETLQNPFCFPSEASQPFALCQGIHVRDSHQLPTTCKARYGGKGRIAEHGYRNPSFCRGHFVVFSDNFFGFYWIDLGSFSLYRLVEENLS